MKIIDGTKILHYEVQKSYKEDDKYVYYLAISPFVEKRVSIVTLNPLLATDPSEQANFKQQKQQLAQLSHPNLPILYDMVEVEGIVYAVEEYVEGHHLQDYIDKISGPIPEEKSVRLFGQLLDVIDSLHQKNIIPTQIHGHNIIITKEENIKFLYSHQAEIKPKSAFVYKSPEELKGKEITLESNIFSLGLVLYQMVAGKYPFAEESNPETIKTQVEKAKFPKANSFYPGVFERVEGILNKALHSNPNNRFRNCEEFKKILSYERFADESIPRKAFQQLPLVVLGVLSLLALILYFYANREVQYVDTLSYNLQDTSAINRQTDSLKRIRMLKVKQDSMRIAQVQARDTMKLYIHKVKRGESLQRIAKRYNMSLGHLQRLNNIESNDDLKAGAGMRVVVRAVHKVLQNENLYTVAKQYELTYYDLVRTNAIEDEKEEVFEGKELLIPLK